MENIQFVKGPIEVTLLQEILKTVSGRAHNGAINIFIGQVRDDVIDGTKVIGIEYEIHKSMADKELQIIIDSVTEKYNVEQIFFVHSEGFVPAGKWSLLVVCSAKHRHQAIMATKELIDLMKKQVPIWKKEIFESGKHRWK